MDWDNFKFVLALQRSGSIRRAARALGVNHATMSRRLAGVNAQLGAPAFQRVGGVYRPTSQGETLVAAALAMERAVYASEREAMGLERAMRGRLSLSLPDAVAQHLLIEELGAFSTAHPGVQLVVHTTNNFADLDHREADVVVRISNDPPDHLVGRRLFKYARCHYCAPNYLAAKDPQHQRWLGWPDDPEFPDWVKHSPRPKTPIGLRIDDVLVRHAAALDG
ncbi:MAG: LysR family transcriptional regulator, partial [Alphaproteobacteria bacterium]